MDALTLTKLPYSSQYTTEQKIRGPANLRQVYIYFTAHKPACTNDNWKIKTVWIFLHFSKFWFCRFKKCVDFCLFIIIMKQILRESKSFVQTSIYCRPVIGELNTRCSGYSSGGVQLNLWKKRYFFLWLWKELPEVWENNPNDDIREPKFLTKTLRFKLHCIFQERWILTEVAIAYIYIYCLWIVHFTWFSFLICWAVPFALVITLQHQTRVIKQAYIKLHL